MVRSQWLGPGLVQVVCDWPGLLDHSLQSPGQEKPYFFIGEEEAEE